MQSGAGGSMGLGEFRDARQAVREPGNLGSKHRTVRKEIHGEFRYKPPSELDSRGFCVSACRSGKITQE